MHSLCRHLIIALCILLHVTVDLPPVIDSTLPVRVQDAQEALTAVIRTSLTAISATDEDLASGAALPLNESETVSLCGLSSNMED